MREWLQKRVWGWKPALLKDFAQFDDAVLAVCKAALEETRDE